MSQFTQKKCPTCGGRLELVSGNKYECRCCHNVYTMNEENTSLYDALQTASVFRESLNFKQAEMLYKNMLKKYADDDLSDVYWNLLLCEQRVMFETDQNGEQFPSFYDISATEIDESEYYGKAMEYAQEYDTSKLMCFVDLANKMQEAKAKYRTIKNSTKPYEIFICFKKSDLLDPTCLTPDYQLAYDLYNHLSKDYNVFFSEKSLDNIVISEYEPNIYHALYTSKIMLVICSDINYLNSQWVKNEWSRFKMMTRTSATAKRIIPIFTNGFNPEQLPEELRSCQGLNADIHLMERLSTNVRSVLNPVDREAELAAKLKADMQAQMEAFAKQFASTAPQKSTNDAPTESISSDSITLTQNPKLTNIADPVSKPQAKPNYIVPEGTGAIAVSQFQGNKYIKEAIIPYSVTAIGNKAFNYCTSLSRVVIPNSVIMIWDNAFSYCTSLTNIIIPDSVTSIGDRAFEVSGLKSITIGRNVRSIGYKVFSLCNKLTDIYYKGTIAEWRKIDKATGNFLKGSWNSGTLDYTVHCTDGDLSKKQS